MYRAPFCVWNYSFFCGRIYADIKNRTHFLYLRPVSWFIFGFDTLSRLPGVLKTLILWDFQKLRYSTLIFNRPGMKKLLEAVKNGEICCIIVKDLSRFGRSYLEVSKYIENIFPYLGVRFIAINDNYDSNNHKGTTAEIDVSIRNILNAMYSMDISKKVKSTKRAKMLQGEFASPFTIYGYKKDKIDRGKLLIDEPAAVVVRKIFQLRLDGITVSKIAERLNKERIPIPSVHKNNTGNKKNWRYVAEGESAWTSTKIFRILKDERYTGTFIGGMREISKVGSNESITNPKEKWIRIPNTHPVIIPQEQFDTVSSMINKPPAKNKTKKTSPKLFCKKVKCAKCGHLLHYRGDVGIPFYLCETARYTDEYGCKRGIMIREKDLTEAVMVTLLTQIKLFIDNEKILQMAKNKINKPDISKENSILQLDNEIKVLQLNKRKLYERYKNKEINQNIYLQEREKLEEELANKTEAREVIVSQQKSNEKLLEETKQLFQKFYQYQSEKELTKEMVDEFIEMVSVYSSDRIEIKFKFKDEMEKLIKNLNGGN